MIDAIQIESAYDNRNDPERDSYALAIARATVRYMESHYPQRRDSGADVDTTTEDVETTTSGAASSMKFF